MTKREIATVQQAAAVSLGVVSDRSPVTCATDGRARWITAATLWRGRHPSSRKAELERTHSDLPEWLQAESCATRRRHFSMSVSQTASRPPMTSSAAKLQSTAHQKPEDAGPRRGSYSWREKPSIQASASWRP